jgi:hypothetical protein
MPADIGAPISAFLNSFPCFDARDITSGDDIDVLTWLWPLRRLNFHYHSASSSRLGMQLLSPLDVGARLMMVLMVDHRGW